MGGQNNVAEQAIREKCMRAEEECMGPCAAVALLVLGEVFGLRADSAAFAMGLAVRWPGGEPSPATPVAQGVGMFIACAAQRRGLAKDKILALCAAWQGHWAACAMADSTAVDAVLSGYHFVMANRKQLGLDEAAQKPENYYSNIYSDRESMFKHSSYALEESLTKAVMRGDEAKALAALRQINAMGEKATLAKNPLRSVKNSMIGSIAFLSRAAIQAGVSANEAFSLSDALTQQVEDMQARRQVLDFEERILLYFIGLVRHRLEEAYSPPIIKVMHYIENNLDKTVRLEGAAAYAGVHPAYLSSRFKKETGASFTSYVMTRKIQESSYFVRHTQYPVSQISSLYGFSSQSYYITTFKKVLGSTPMEYRRSHLAE